VWGEKEVGSVVCVSETAVIDGKVEGAVHVRSRSSGNTHLKADQAVGLALDPAALHVFDTEGQALVYPRV